MTDTPDAPTTDTPNPTPAAADLLKPQHVRVRSTFGFDVPGIGSDPARLGRFVEALTSRAVGEQIAVDVITISRSHISTVCSLRRPGSIDFIFEDEIDEIGPENVDRAEHETSKALSLIVQQAADESRFTFRLPDDGPYVAVLYYDVGMVLRRYAVSISAEAYAAYEALIAAHGPLDIFVRGPLDRLRLVFTATVVTLDVAADGSRLAATVDHVAPNRRMRFTERLAAAVEELLQKPLRRLVAGEEPTP